MRTAHNPSKTRVNSWGIAFSFGYFGQQWVYTYPKNEMADLTDKQLAELAKVAKKEFDHG